MSERPTHNFGGILYCSTCDCALHACICEANSAHEQEVEEQEVLKLWLRCRLETSVTEPNSAVLLFASKLRAPLLANIAQLKEETRQLRHIIDEEAKDSSAVIIELSEVRTREVHISAAAKDTLEILEQFKYESDEDSQSYAFFEARLNEDGFFIAKHALENALSASSTEVAKFLAERDAVRWEVAAEYVARNLYDCKQYAEEMRTKAKELRASAQTNTIKE